MNLKWYEFTGFGLYLFLIVFLANYLSLTVIFNSQEIKQKQVLEQQHYQQQANEACKGKKDNEILKGNMKQPNGVENPVCILCNKELGQFVDCNQISTQNSMIQQQGGLAETH